MIRFFLSSTFKYMQDERDEVLRSIVNGKPSVPCKSIAELNCSAFCCQDLIVFLQMSGRSSDHGIRNGRYVLGASSS